MATLSKENPYVGPRTFTPEERSKFYGRDRETRELTAVIISNRLVLFYAPSGAGKSSLLNTMVQPALVSEGCEVLPVGRVSGFGDEVQADNIYVYNLMLSLHQEARTPADLEHLTLSAFLDDLIRGSGGKYRYDPGYTYAPDAVFRPRVLIIDQFEELLTTNVAHWEERAGFFEQLADALAYDDQLWVVLTMREDFVARLDPYLHLLPNRLRYRYYMERLAAHEALEAIRWPAQTAGRPFEDKAAQRLVDNLRCVRADGVTTEDRLEPFVEPVQLQAVCYQMWEKLRERPGEMITVDDVERFADVDTALTNFYENTVAQTVAATGVAETDLRNWFDHELITEAGTRNMVFRGEETTGSLPTGVADYLRSQFILRDVVRPGGTWLELVHDGFVAPIVGANNAWKQQQPLIRLAQEWDDAGRPDDLLLGGKRLEKLDEQEWKPLGPLVAAYVAAGHEAQARAEARLTAAREKQRENELTYQRELAQRQKALAESEAARAGEAEEALARQRRLVGALFSSLAVVLIIAVLAGVFWYQGRESAREAQDNAALANRNAALANSNAAAANANATAAYDNATRAAEEANENAIIAARNATLAAIANDSASAAYENATRAAEALQEARAAQEETERLAQASNVQSLTSLAALLTDQSHANDELSLLLNVEAAYRNAQYGTPLLGAVEDALRTALLRPYFSTELPGHGNSVSAVAVAPGGSLLASASLDGTVRLWNLDDPTAEPRILSDSQGAIWSVAFSPDGSLLAAGNSDATVSLWNLDDPDGAPRSLEGHIEAVRTVAFTPDGSRLASGGEDDTILLWDLDDRSVDRLSLDGHTGDVLSVTFSTDGAQLASASTDGTVLLWNLRASPPNWRVLDRQQDPATSVAFSPDGAWLASASEDLSIRLWRLPDLASPPRVLELQHTDAINALAFSPDSRWLASASSDKSVRLWSLEDLSAAPEVLAGHTQRVTSVAFSSDGSRLVSASDDRTARLWDLTPSPVEPVILAGHNDAVWSVAIAPDGSWLASAGVDQTIRLWDLNDLDAEPRLLEGGRFEVWSVAFSPDGAHLASAHQDGSILLWDLTDPDVRPLAFEGHTNAAVSVAFAPDGSRLASASLDRTVRLWDLNNLESAPQIISDHRGRVYAVAFSPDGALLASGSEDRTVRLWNLNDPAATPRVLEGHPGTVWSVAFAPDGSRLASASETTVRLWDLDHLDVGPQILAGHTGTVWSTKFSPDGSRLASASDDRTIRLWDLNNVTAEPVIIAGHGWSITSVAFSPDGMQLFSASLDGAVQRTPVTFEHLVELACSKVRRNLTWEEWQQNSPLHPFYRLTCPDLPAHPSVAAEFASRDEAEREQQFAVLQQQALAAAMLFEQQMTQHLSSVLLERAVELILQGNSDEAADLVEQIDPRVDRSTAIIDLWLEAEAEIGLDSIERAREIFEATRMLGQPERLVVDTYDGFDLNQLCWRGSLIGFARDVFVTCEAAAEQYPDHGGIVDSRGVARALTGDIAGALEDFHFFLNWIEENGFYYDEDVIASRHEIIAALEAGKDPFDEDMLMRLLPQ